MGFCDTLFNDPLFGGSGILSTLFSFRLKLEEYQAAMLGSQSDARGGTVFFQRRLSEAVAGSGLGGLGDLVKMRDVFNDEGSQSVRKTSMT